MLIHVAPLCLATTWPPNQPATKHLNHTPIEVAKKGRRVREAQTMSLKLRPGNTCVAWEAYSNRARTNQIQLQNYSLLVDPSVGPILPGVAENAIPSKYGSQISPNQPKKMEPLLMN